mgnify:CR=1
MDPGAPLYQWGALVVHCTRGEPGVPPYILVYEKVVAAEL